MGGAVVKSCLLATWALIVPVQGAEGQRLPSKPAPLAVPDLMLSAGVSDPSFRFAMSAPARDHRWTGAIIGAAAVGLAGVALAAGFCDYDGQSQSTSKCTFNIVFAGVFGAAIGAGAGAMIGSLFPNPPPASP